MTSRIYITHAPIGSVVILAAVALFYIDFVLADGSLVKDKEERCCETGCAPSSLSNDGNRLPRVLPGEEVETASGKRMKVWTTEGPVAVAPAPEPFRLPRHELNPENLQIYVDDDPRAKGEKSHK